MMCPFFLFFFPQVLEKYCEIFVMYSQIKDFLLFDFTIFIIYWMQIFVMYLEFSSIGSKLCYTS